MKLRRSPSAAHTWTECTAQPLYIQQFEDKLPPNDTEFNREGTIAHGVVEGRFNEDATAYTVKGFKPEMKKHAEGFVAFCRGLQGSTTTQWWSERKVPLFYAPGSNGYVDFAAFTPDGDLIIADYKYGQGVSVTAEENLQMAIYAVSLIQVELGIWNPYKKVTMAIYQPRVRQGEPVTTWTLSYGELLQFVEERVVAPSRDIETGNVKFCASSKVCQFCPAAGFCGMQGFEPSFPFTGRMRASDLLDDTPLAPLRKGLPARIMKPEALEQDVLTKLVLKKKEITKFLGDVEEYAEAMLAAGKPVAGLKLVQGRGGHRSWRNEDEVKEILLAHLEREQVITEKVITPSQADQFEHDLPKELWAAIKSLTFKPEGGPVIAATSDPRPVFGEAKAGLNLLEDETAEDWI